MALSFRVPAADRTTSPDHVADRRAATLIGVLFIVGTVAGALSMIMTGSLLAAPDAAVRIAADPGRMVAGVLLLLTMAFALALVPVVFWPIGRRYSEVLSMGYVVFRGALETVTYIVGAMGWLLLVELARSDPTSPGAAYIRTAETLLWDQVIAIPFVLGALMFCGVLYQARLVPRWLAAWGLAGAVLYLVAPLAAMFDQGWGFAMAPLAVQEMVLAAWLIARGFRPPVVAPSRAGAGAAQVVAG